MRVNPYCRFFIGFASICWPTLSREVTIDPGMGGRFERDIRVKNPQRLYPSEAGWLELTILPARVLNEKDTLVEVRMDLPGLEIPGQEKGQVIKAKEESRFIWKLDATKTGVYDGKL
jgi:hypothetical protein